MIVHAMVTNALVHHGTLIFELYFEKQEFINIKYKYSYY